MSKALQLADALEYIPDKINREAAAELRRLHAESELNEKLLAFFQRSRMRLQEQREEFKAQQARSAELVERLQKLEAELLKLIK
jgi:uncharacterized membrane-anchored protein YhcB (DUF1043 family)